MSRSDLVRLFVLIEIGDDYENVDQVIFPNVAKLGTDCGLTIERCEIVAALAWLIENGLARAYLLSCFEPYATELKGMPSVDQVEEDFETYFYITKKGLEHHFVVDRSWWPFDDQDNLRPDWVLDGMP